MRVTQRSLYGGLVDGLQTAHAALLKTAYQEQNGRKINTPSDDPLGTAIMLNTRQALDRTAQLKKNVSAAKGWLTMSTETLGGVSTLVGNIKAKALDAATDGKTHDNRKAIAKEVRAMFGTLLGLSNQEFGRKSIFAGHKYNTNAYEEALAVSTMDKNLKDVDFAVSGKTKQSMMVVFNATGTVHSDPNQATDLEYQWSNDGGATWNKGVMAAGQNVLTIDGMTLAIPNGTSVTAQDSSKPIGAENGTMLYIRPTAVYQGDIQGVQPHCTIRSGGQPGLVAGAKGKISANVLVEVVNNPVDLHNAPGSLMEYRYSTDNGVTWTNAAINLPRPATGKATLKIPGGSIEIDSSDPLNPTVPVGTRLEVQPRRADIMGGPTGLQANVQGSYDSDVLVRVDSPPPPLPVPPPTSVDISQPGNVVYYSYSEDNGATWIKGSVQTTTSGTIRLPLPGGYMDLQEGGDPNLTFGTQVLIHPERADLQYEIMNGEYVTVNNVGTDLFGGRYNGDAVEPSDENLFEIMGDLIAYLENNNRTGIGKCLENIDKAHAKLLAENARVGALLSNRVNLAEDVLDFQEISLSGRLSDTENADLALLKILSSSQQLGYQTAIRSARDIMQLNLASHL